MTTVDEIEAAIERLSVAERELLESRLLSRRFGLDSLDAAQREELPWILRNGISIRGGA